ncbi:hypothetical protein ACL02T_34255 [Pseudonocardia sp. RS010]|uniref:hypothetical protein n=1 Tax=Pseudonocardia sp. RS010 TaxID=3385979 RepID=UPI0039A3299F
MYRTTRDQGIVGIFDFLSDAQPHPDMRWAAYGVLRAVTPFLPRDVLLADGDLGSTFRHMRGRKSLPALVGERLLELLPRLPDFATTDELLPGPEEHWEWIPARPETDWGSEAAMRDALAIDQNAWKSLGFKARPLTEKRPPGSTLRMDLYDHGVIAECKNVLSGLEVLRQLDGYLDLCHRDAGGQWTGHIVVSAGYTTELARAVRARRNIRLWECRRAIDGRPTLTEVRV